MQVVLRQKGEQARVVDLPGDSSLGDLFAQEGIKRDSMLVRIDGAVRREDALFSAPLKDGVEVQLEVQGDQAASVEKMVSVHIGAIGKLQIVNLPVGATYGDALKAGGVSYGTGIQVRSGGREVTDLNEKLQEEGQQPILILGKIRGGVF